MLELLYQKDFGKRGYPRVGGQEKKRKGEEKRERVGNFLRKNRTREKGAHLLKKGKD